jgi:sulfur carrier protein ThiS
VETTTDEEGSDIVTAPIALGALGLIVVAVVAYVVFFAGSGGGEAGVAGQEPSNLGSVHYHGPMTMTVDGDRVDFSRSQYQLQNDAFHFEGGNGERWHGHAQGVTLEYATSTLGIDVTESTVAFQGTTYRNSDSGTSVAVEVNGESVTPSEYVLQEGDRIRIAVEQSADGNTG